MLNPVNPKDWVSCAGRQYLRGREFKRTHVWFLRLIDWIVELVWLDRRQRSPEVHPLSHLVVCKPDHIGDLLMITPFLAEVAKTAPAGRPHITLITGRWNAECASLLKELRLCDEIEFIDLPVLAKGWRSLYWVREFVADTARILSRLRTLKPFTFIELRPYAPNGLFLGLLADADCIAGFGTRGFGGLIDIPLPYNSSQTMGQMFLDAGKHIGATCKSKSLYKGPRLKGMAVEQGKRLLSAWDIASRPFVLMHAESRDPRKCVPTAKWREVIEVLRRLKPELVVVLVGVARSGANADASNLLKISGLTVVDAVGQTSFRAVAQLCALASGAICVDSVVSHLSLAFENPTLVLLGSGSSNRLAYPADNADVPLFIVETTGVNTVDLRDVGKRFALSLDLTAQKHYETRGSS